MRFASTEAFVRRGRGSAGRTRQEEILRSRTMAQIAPILNSEELIRVHIHGDEDVFRKGQFIERLAHHPA